MTTLYGYVSNQGAPEYDDIMQSDLSPEEKVKQIKIRGQAYRDDLDAKLRKDLAKQYAGAALEIGSAAIPIGAGARLAGLAGKGLSTGAKYLLSSGLTGGLSGGVFGAGRGLMEDENPFVTAGQDALVGGLTGVGFGALTNPARMVKPGTLFIGGNAKTADEEALKLAQNWADLGMNSKDIWKQTGWFRGVDGKWRYEIPDGTLKDKVNWIELGEDKNPVKFAKLSDIYDNPAFYNAYPEASDMSVNVYNLKNGVGGAYDPKWNSIDLDKAYTYLKTNPQQLSAEGWNENALKALQHELQHYIQNVEDFAQGSNLDMAKNALNYANSAGEVEARLAETRTGLNNRELKAFEPFTQNPFGYDVHPYKQILNNKNGLKYGTGNVYKLKDDILPEPERIAQAEKQLSADIEAHLSGTLPRGRMISFGYPSDILQKYGVPNLEMRMPTHKFDMSTHRKAIDGNIHNVPDNVIKKVPSLLRNPKMIMKSATKGFEDSRYVVQLNKFDADGNPVLVIIDYNSANRNINLIPSIYGKEEFNKFLLDNYQNIIYRK